MMSILRTGGSLASTRMVFAAASAAWRISPRARFLTTPPPPPAIDTDELLKQVSSLQQQVETLRTHIVARKREERSTANLMLDGTGCLCFLGIIGWVVYSIANLGIEQEEKK